MRRSIHRGERFSARSAPAVCADKGRTFQHAPHDAADHGAAAVNVELEALGAHQLHTKQHRNVGRIGATLGMLAGSQARAALATTTRGRTLTMSGLLPRPVADVAVVSAMFVASC